MWLFIATLFLTQAAANSEDVMEHTKGANPETIMNISQMICYRGYPSEEYEVLTPDGYYVILNRIPHGREKPGNGAFIAFSSMPELAQKIKMFFALAPAVIIKHAKSPIMKMAFLLDRQFKIFQLFLGQTDASLRMRKLWRFLPDLCRHPVLHKPCATLLFLLGGYNEKNLNMTRLDVYTAHYPDRTSVKNMIHWAQVMTSGDFKAFDYGSENQAIYHQEIPPSYQLEKMTVPTAVWSGGEDWAADWRDVHLLLPRIAHVVSYVHIADWNHWDFIWGLDAPGRLYSHILALMERSR